MNAKVTTTRDYQGRGTSTMSRRCMKIVKMPLMRTVTQRCRTWAWAWTWAKLQEKKEKAEMAMGMGMGMRMVAARRRRMGSRR